MKLTLPVHVKVKVDDKTLSIEKNYNSYQRNNIWHKKNNPQNKFKKILSNPQTKKKWSLEK